jgi:3-deoxy-manno-octulosonate cytidylyltransferase (CMP-KDO synthetase)
VLDNRILGVLPARLRAERLPRKPLVEIAGRPLIEWVWRKVSGFTAIDACVIATDSAEIEAACRRFGARVELTAASHPSGTDRVAEVAAMPAWSEYGIIVNVQGDEPLIEEETVTAAIEQVRSGMDIGTVATPIREVAAYADPSVVKVTRRQDGAALYFSRAPIPYRRDGAPTEADLADGVWLRHVGVYAFRRDALERWVSLPAHALEETERLEQLRPLAAERGVDTPADVERVAARLLTIAQEQTHITREARP